MTFSVRTLRANAHACELAAISPETAAREMRLAADRLEAMEPVVEAALHWYRDDTAAGPIGLFEACKAYVAREK